MAGDLSAALLEIRLALGLKITELAQVLKVERQTIYAWLKPESAAKPQAKNAERLAKIALIASRWKGSGSSRSARTRVISPGPSGTPSLLDRMAQDDIDTAFITAALLSESTVGPDAIAKKGLHKGNLQELRKRGFRAPPQQAESIPTQVRLNTDGEA